MKSKLTKPEDVKVNDGKEDIKAVDKNGNELLPSVEPDFIGTKPIKLSRSHPLQAVNLLFPPGISRFYVERLNKNEIRFLIRTSEITRLADKAEKMMQGSKKPKMHNEAHD